MRQNVGHEKDAFVGVVPNNEWRRREVPVGKQTLRSVWQEGVRDMSPVDGGDKGVWHHQLGCCYFLEECTLKSHNLFRILGSETMQELKEIKNIIPS